MLEVIKTFKDTKEYLDYINKQDIDEVYKEAVDEVLDKESINELVNEAFKELADAEAELLILEDLFINNKVVKNEIIKAKKRCTKANNRLNELYSTKEEIYSHGK